MKMLRLFVLALVMACAFVVAPEARAQTGTTDPTDTLSAALINEFEKDYDIVFKSIKTALEGLGFEVNYSSKKRNLIETSFKVLVDQESEASFDDVMGQYGDIPYIRSPGWTVGRTKVTVNLEKLENGKISVKVRALMSGYEARFNNAWMYWKSNGKVEQSAMDAIITAVETAS